MTIQQAIQSKWNDVPMTKEEAEAALKRQPCCLACGSQMLLPLVRPPIDTVRRFSAPSVHVWRAHCNHCGSEVPIAVMLNNEAWRVTAQEEWQMEAWWRNRHRNVAGK